MEKESNAILRIIGSHGAEVLENLRAHSTFLLPAPKNKDAEDHVRRILQSSALKVPKIIMKDIGIDVEGVATKLDDFGAYAYLEKICARHNLDVKIICGDYAPNSEFSVTLAIILDITANRGEILEVTKLIFDECFIGKAEPLCKIEQVFRKNKANSFLFSPKLEAKIQGLNGLGKVFLHAHAKKLLQKKMMENGKHMSNNEFRQTSQRMGNDTELMLALDAYRDAEVLNLFPVQDRQGNRTDAFIAKLNYELEFTPHSFYATVRTKKLRDMSYDTFLADAIVGYQLKVNRRLMNRQREVDGANEELERDFELHQRTTGVNSKKQAREDTDAYIAQMGNLQRLLTHNWENFRIIDGTPAFPFNGQQGNAQPDINPENPQNVNPQQAQQNNPQNVNPQQAQQNNPENNAQENPINQENDNRVFQQRQGNFQAQNNMQNENERNN